jgi:hypothetical protein
MSFGIRIILLGMGLILFLAIFELVRRKRFREELSITWFAVAIALMASSVADKLVDPFARRLGIGYPPALVFAWIIFCLILALLYFSSVISDLIGKIKELSQKIALLESEIDKKADADNKEDGA